MSAGAEPRAMTPDEVLCLREDFRSYREPEVIGRLLATLDALRAERDALLKDKDEYAEVEAALCPEDVRFAEYIAALRARSSRADELLAECIDMIAGCHDYDMCDAGKHGDKCEDADLLARIDAHRKGGS